MRAIAQRRGPAAVALAVALSLALAASAAAWRKPTASERRAITRVASQASHAGNAKVRVSRIRVSTVGPWASATVTILVGGQPDSATDILHRVHGTWRNASIGTAGEACVMPLKDRRNLGLDSYPC